MVINCLKMAYDIYKCLIKGKNQIWIKIKKHFCECLNKFFSKELIKNQAILSTEINKTGFD